MSAAETVYQKKVAELAFLEQAFLNAARNVIKEKAGIAIIENSEVRDAMDELIHKLGSIETFPGSKTLTELLEATKGIEQSVRTAMDDLGKKISSLEEHRKPDSLASMKAERQSLESRRWAVQNRQQLLADARNRYTKNGIEQVRKSCSTRSITAFVSEVSQSEVIGRMQSCFNQELSMLNVKNSLYHLALEPKPGGRSKKSPL